MLLPLQLVQLPCKSSNLFKIMKKFNLKQLMHLQCLSFMIYLSFPLTGIGRIVAMMERNGILKIANVGDCGLKIIRKGSTTNI